MSKTIGVALKSHLSGEVTTLATLWKLTLTDTTVFAFTDHDEDITYDGVTYKSYGGYLPSAISQLGNLSVDNLSVTGFMEASIVTEADIRAGRLDFATVDIYLVNYKDLTQGDMVLAEGWTLGEITVKDNHFEGEIRSKSQKLQQNIIDLYSPSCRADLGDTKCLIDISSTSTWTYAGTVTAVTDNQVFTDTGSTYADDYFVYGQLTWTTGLNIGYGKEIKTFSSGEFGLTEKMPLTISTGDTFEVYAGCDKFLATCRDKFDNVINFRGEPYLPGEDEILKVGTR